MSTTTGQAKVLDLVTVDDAIRAVRTLQANGYSQVKAVTAVALVLPESVLDELTARFGR